jgi:hypothetical protein
MDQAKALSRVQTAADEMNRLSLCGQWLPLTVARLKLECNLFTQEAQLLSTAAQQFVADTEKMYELCDEAYRELFLKMYRALGGDAAEKGGALRPSGVPIDPASALNYIQTGMEQAQLTPTVYFTLYNDNEALIKLPQSSLAKVPNIDAQIEEMDRFFLAHCDTIHCYYLTYQRLLDALDPLSLSRFQVHQTVATIHITLSLPPQPPCSEEAADTTGLHNELLAATRELTTCADNLYLTRKQECYNLLHYRDNTTAKWMESVQLYHKMTHTYRLATVHAPLSSSSSSSPPLSSIESIF